MLTNSNTISKNFIAPNFKILNIDKKIISLDEIKGINGTLVCLYVIIVHMLNL